MKYLIDTNTCMYYIKGQFDLKERFEKADPANCFISEITLAELKFGVENSERKERNQKALDDFLTGINVVTNNTAHFKRLNEIELEDWTK